MKTFGQNKDLRKRRSLSLLLIVVLLNGIFLSSVSIVGNSEPMPGPEFKVNTYIPNNQRFPSAAMDSNGNFVIVWESLEQDGDFRGVFAQLYNRTGVPQGSEFQVNTYTTDGQMDPSVAMAPNGIFVITWWSNGQDGDGGGIFAQRYNSAGVPQGLEFQVNTYSTDNQTHPDVAMDSNGNFVIAWHSDEQDGDGVGVFAQRYISSGFPQGSEFQVNTYTTDNQGSPSVAMDSNGNFMIAWSSNGQDGDGQGVFAQRYNSAGIPQGSEFQVNTYITSSQTNPSVAMDPNGNFVIAWSSNGQDGNKSGVFAQRFDNAGIPQGTEFQVNTYTTNSQVSPSVAVDSNCNFVIAWDSREQDGSFGGIFAQRYNSTGIPQGSEFQVNIYTTSWQSDPQAAMDSNGNFVIAWYSAAQDTDFSGAIYARLYYDQTPPEISDVLLDDGITHANTLIVENDLVTTVYLNATIDDSNTGNSSISFANYTADKDNWSSSKPMNSSDGAFDEPTENVTITIDISSWPGGTYELWVYGSDVLGNRNLTGAKATLVIQDTTSPIISDVTAIPDPQQVYEAVNISANITDIGQLFGVSVEIYDPDLNYVGNFSMLYDPINGRYYWNQSYDILGTYTFTIYVNDTSDNWNSYSGPFVIQATMILKQGWNLISIPLIQEEQDLKKVLDSINGLYDAVQRYDLTDKNDYWKHHKVGKPFGNDLTRINETMGFWIHITQPGDTVFFINGTRIFQNQTVTLYEGWNLVGYPSRTNKNRTVALNNLTFSDDVEAIWTYDAATQKWEEIGEGDFFEIGRGYWFHAFNQIVWKVPL